MSRHQAAFALGFSCMVLATATPSATMPGVSAAEIRIGQTMPYSGPHAQYGAIGRAQSAYFAKVNAEGGIRGRKVSLISLDDG